MRMKVGADAGHSVIIDDGLFSSFGDLSSSPLRRASVESPRVDLPLTLLTTILAMLLSCGPVEVDDDDSVSSAVLGTIEAGGFPFSCR